VNRIRTGREGSGWTAGEARHLFFVGNLTTSVQVAAESFQVSPGVSVRIINRLAGSRAR
jgi:hypothetical protein